MSNEFFERKYRKLKYLSIPEDRPVLDARDRFTRIDEELAEIIRGLDIIIDKLSGIQVPMPIPQTPTIIREKEVIKEEKTSPIQQLFGTNVGKVQVVPLAFHTVPTPMMLIGRKAYLVGTDKDTVHELNTITQYVQITIFDSNVYIDLQPVDVGNSMLYPMGSVIIWARHPNYQYLYFRAEDKKARVYVSEWRLG